MLSATIKKMELAQRLIDVPDEKLDDVQTFLDTLLESPKKSKQKPRLLRGIWKGKGFEKIVDLKTELIQARQEMNAAILSKGW